MRSAKRLWLVAALTLIAGTPAMAKNEKIAVDLVAPANGALFTAPALISLNARAQAKQDHHPIVRVDFYAGANLIGTAQGPQAGDVYTVPWANDAPGVYIVTAAAINDKGDTDTSDPVTITVNAPPSVRITAPANDAVFNEPGAFTITATASDSDGAIAKVEIYEGQTLLASLTSAPYAVGLSGLAPGSYTFTALATDDRGAQATSAALALRVNALPSVSLTSPATSAAFRAPATVPMEALVSDSDGSIARVEFYYGSTLIATLNAAPYTFSWTGVPQGTYALTARAVDDLGATVSSTAVEISVAPGQAQLFYIHVDHLNTPRLVADSTGVTAWRNDNTEPFGDSVADENPSGLGAFKLPLRLPGQRYDVETGLYYNYFRDYDPNLGRYDQSDPLGLAAGPNTYMYVRAAPLRYGDPMGLAGCGPEDGWENYVIPNNPIGFPFEPCCDAHDRCYDNCKGPGKLGCDTNFCGCVFDKCKRYTGYVQMACRRTAQEYCYRVLDSASAAEQFKKARNECKGCK